MGTRLIAWLAACLVLGCLATARAADEVYQSREDFLVRSFDGQPPEPALLWIRGSVRDHIKAILGHRYPGIRIRYWARGQRTAWILEEIGKYKPITTGFVVEQGRIRTVKVLIYRESHGWEVRYPFFTDQFRDVRLTKGWKLTRDIDNISGATLSVNALTRLAALALYLHDQAVSGE